MLVYSSSVLQRSNDPQVDLYNGKA
uniref:Uncharacterized protein n=1 Tax=Anguilla anguilla TaxID=7936 RepID=A0A0E9VE32_ANGAN